jgi:hypothetical protein
MTTLLLLPACSGIAGMGMARADNGPSIPRYDVVAACKAQPFTNLEVGVYSWADKLVEPSPSELAARRKQAVGPCVGKAQEDYDELLARWESEPGEWRAACVAEVEAADHHAANRYGALSRCLDDTAKAASTAVPSFRYGPKVEATPAQGESTTKAAPPAVDPQKRQACRQQTSFMWICPKEALYDASPARGGGIEDAVLTRRRICERRGGDVARCMRDTQ